jgi:hypothetical protein
MRPFRRFAPLLWVGVLLLPAGRAAAEPYLAVQSGFKCVQCHANPTGGGLRNVFGNTYAQTELAARRLTSDKETWTGLLNRHIALGGNLRADATWNRVPNQSDSNQFEIAEARLLLDAAIIPERLSVYVDERLAPGNADNLEANLRLWVQPGRFYLKAGRFYLPFGWRLEDDNAFVRQASGINMQAPDRGLEIGLETGPWSMQLALTNGSGGSQETDDGKQVAARVEHVISRWRLGASAAFNDSDAGDRASGALFGGVRLGPTSWLAEIDLISDDLDAGSRDMLAALVEVNWRIARGRNLKLTHEWFEPDSDIDEDEQTRSSAVYEWWPIEFLQLRVGARLYDGIPQNDLQNRREAFAQLHAYF